MNDTPETDRLAEEFKRNTLPDSVKLDILFEYTRKLERECIRLEQGNNKKVIKQNSYEVVAEMGANCHMMRIIEAKDEMQARKIMWEKHMDDTQRDNCLDIEVYPVEGV